MRATLARWSEALGATGIAGLAIAVLCGVFYTEAIRPGAERLDQMRSKLARLERLHALRAREGLGAGGESTEERLQGFYKVLASEHSLGELINTIDTAARRNGVVLKQGSYRFVLEAGSRFGRYEVTYSGQTPYFRARIFLNEVLRDLPMLSLDEVSFLRQQTSAGSTELAARFSILVRRDS